MAKFASLILALCAFIVALAGCDIPKPPPELATPTPGSQNPESELSIFNTPAPPTAAPEQLTPLPVGAGTIYFVREGKLWRVSPDGSGERALSSLTITASPSPSPDGKWLAFLSGRDLYVLTASGGNARKLATDHMAERQRLGWSPDGMLLGYMTYDPLTVGQEQAWSVPIEGGDPLLITTIKHGALGRGPTFERMVKWSPDGKWVAVSNVTNPFRLLRWPLSTGREGDARDIPGGEIDWSPDSRVILYSEALNGALGLYQVLKNEGEPYRNEQSLVGTGLGEHAQGPLPQFSPASSGADSDLIAYRSRTTTSGEARVAIRRRGGRELLPLPPLTNNPAWSPAGDRLVVETGTMRESALGKQWSPTGISIAHLDSDGNHYLTPLVANATWPAWGR